MRYSIIFGLILTMVLSFNANAWQDGEWKVVYNPTTQSYQPTNLFFFDENTAWSMKSYHSKTILKKMFGAPSKWSDLKEFPYHFNEMYFKTKFLGWMTGSDGKIIKTTNGGQVWHAMNSGTTKDLFDIAVVDRFLWVVGKDNTILHSNNGGKTWIPQNSSLKAKYTLLAVAFVTPNKGWAAGYRVRDGKQRAVIIHTSDGGKTWRGQTDNIAGTNRNFIPRNITVTDAGWVYIVGSHARFLMSTDEGKTWKPNPHLRYGEKTSFNKIFFATATHGWIVGDHGRVIKTKDAGFRWNEEQDPIPACEGFCNLLDIHMLSPELGYAVTAWGKIIKYSVNE